jgi:hypothetical protein
MRLRVSSAPLSSALVAFLRDAGCIAYVADDGEIEVIRPGAAGDREEHEIEELVRCWSAAGDRVDVVRRTLS